MKDRYPGWLLFLGALIAIAPLSIDMYLPAFPAMVEALGSHRGQIERTLPIFLLGLSIGQMVYGPLSDRFGRRAPLLIGLCIYSLGSAGCVTAASAEALSWWRLLQALGGGAGLVIARAVIRDRLGVRDSAQAISTVMLIMGAAPIIAPMLGSAVLSLAGWQAIFVIQVFFGIACMGWAAWNMSETRPLAAVRPLSLSRVGGTYLALVRDSSFILPALCAGLAMGGLFAYIAGSPFVFMRVLGISEQHFGFVFALNAFGLIAASQINGYLLRKRSPGRILRFTIAVPFVSTVLLCVLCLWQSPSPGLLLLAFFTYVSSIGGISPNTSAIAMAHQGGRAGAASAVLGALSYAMGMLAGLAVSLFSGDSVLPLALIMLVCGSLSYVCGLATLRSRREEAPSDDAELEPLA